MINLEVNQFTEPFNSYTGKKVQPVPQISTKTKDEVSLTACTKDQTCQPASDTKDNRNQTKKELLEREEELGKMIRAKKRQTAQSPLKRKHDGATSQRTNFKPLKIQPTVPFKPKQTLVRKSWIYCGDTLVKSTIEYTHVSHPKFPQVRMNTEKKQIPSFSNHPSPNFHMHSPYKLVRNKMKMANSKQRERQTGSKYCIFYNRFGRCNRGDKCHYVHDPARIAICTRYLKRGTCSVKDCPFSHELVPGKVPTCRFYLRGCCHLDNCPYLHVNVGKGAKVCDDFLDGLCPLGDKCKKSHNPVCPEFNSTGKCLNGNMCRMPA